MSSRTGAVSASSGVCDAMATEPGSGTRPAGGGIGTVRPTVGGGARTAVESDAPVPVPPFQADKDQPPSDWSLQSYLELAARSGAVPCARHHARQVLWEWGLKELVEPIELVVSEIITNAIRASGGLDGHSPIATSGTSTIRFWLAAEEASVLVLVWDASPSQPERQEPGPDADSGRGLLLVEAYCDQWGSFVPDGWSGKVVWALCQM